jgi:hypothetical protein
MSWMKTETFNKSEFNKYLVMIRHKISYPTDHDGNSEEHIQRKCNILYTIYILFTGCDKDLKSNWQNSA